MNDPDLTLDLSGMYRLDLKRDDDGTALMHLYEPFGSLHSEIGMEGQLDAKSQTILADWLRGHENDQSAGPLYGDGM